MRNAEARVTLGVISARQGDLEEALDHGRRAITSTRMSLPSLLMVTSELGIVLADRYRTDTAATEYLHQLRRLRSPAA